MKGVLAMIIASVSFGLMGFFIKLTYRNNPRLQGGDVLLVRSLIMFPAYYAYAKILRVDLLDINVRCARVLFLRCLFGTISMTLMFVSIKMLPTSISFMIFNLNPVFVSVLAYFILKESTTRIDFF